MAGQGRVDDTWEEVVGRLDDGVVRRLLVDAAKGSDHVGRAVRLASADSSERISVLQDEVDGGLKSGRFLDYWASSRWAVEASPIVDALEEVVATEPSAELVALLQRAIRHVVKVLLKADDSNGMIGELAHRLLELHEQACDACAPDAKALAKWMVRFNFEDQDFFVADPVRYAKALGDDGIAVFRREVGKRAAHSSSFTLQTLQQRLAVLDGDVDQIVSLLGGDLSSAYEFTRVAEAMIEIGRFDDALAWARKGIDTTTGWQVAGLFDLSAGVLTKRRDAAGVVALRREHHQRTPSSSTYAALRAAADAIDGWSDEVDQARALLAARDRGGYVDALLADGDSEQAWDVATAESDWDAGEQRWLRLAEARETADPAGAFGVYLKLAEVAILTKADRRQYQLAARRLKDARRAAASAGLDAEFEAHVLGLREEYRRRPSLMAVLDKAGLP